MTVETRCAKSDLEPAMCSHCRGLDLPEIRDLEIKHRAVAKYDGYCTDCGRKIDAGETEIALTGDGSWLCADCAGGGE